MKISKTSKRKPAARKRYSGISMEECAPLFVRLHLVFSLICGSLRLGLRLSRVSHKPEVLD